MSARTVQCVKLGKPAEGLSAPPFSGALGREIFERVSAEAWKEWQSDVMIKIINEYRLDLSDSAQYEVLLKQMRSFLNLDSGQTLEVGNAERGRTK